MRIQNNITALNTHRNYNIANNQVASSAEKLSSGFRINRAGDDAAGLAISEKMRAQIRGLNMASKNSMDAVSLIQTAEGALQSTHDILQRMRELAVQSSSDTNEQVIDRGALQLEFDALKTEINDIAAKTRFNDQNLIDGTFSKYSVAVGGTALGRALTSTMGTRVSATGEKYGTFTFTATANAAVAASTTGGAAASLTHTKGTGGTSTSIVEITAASSPGLITSAMNGNTYTLLIEEQGGNNLVFKIQNSANETIATSASIDIGTWSGDSNAANTVNIDGFGTLTFKNGNAAVTTANQISDLKSAAYAGSKIAVANGADAVVTEAKAASVDLELGGETINVKAGDTSVTFRDSGITLHFDGALRDKDIEAASAAVIGAIDAKTVVISALKGNSLTIQSGANQGDEVAINIDKMNATALGIEGSSIRTRGAASRAITEVNDAINKVSTQRAALGALQNRMEFKIANLDTSAENLQAAESRIRDVDMAKEMTAFSKKNILVQAATAMLAQANSAPQNVLQLLR